MSQVLKFCWLAGVALLAFATPAFAQAVNPPLISFSPSFGAGLILIGAGLGIAKIGAAAVESMARQPEASGDIRGGMLLAAALIEGATFFALIVCIMAVILKY